MLSARASRANRLLPIAVVSLMLFLPLFAHGRSNLRVAALQKDRGVRRGIYALAAVLGRAPPKRKPTKVARVADVELSAYRDLGSWIDIYNHWPWRHPTLAVRKLHERGVRTLFLQTSTYGQKNPIFHPRTTGRFLRAAHKRGMKVVAWYVPSFAHPQIDFHRSRAAIRFKKRGHRFDSFAMDIEATVVADIRHRNRRLLKLSKEVRRLAGPDYALGAITPDPVKALYWPDFPYKSVGRLYDVFVPMGYFSFRADGYKRVKRYTSSGIHAIRRAAEDPKVPIHFIGGIGGDTDPPEVKGFVRAAKGHELIGASYYDFSATTDREWKELEALAAPGPKPLKRTQEPARKAPKKIHRRAGKKERSSKKHHRQNRSNKRRQKDRKLNLTLGRSFP